MKNKKIAIRFFTICEWKKEEEYLREEHKNGWKFEKLNFLCCYHFKRCEMEDVVYQLDYNVNVSDKNEYIKMFNDCGWEYIQDFFGYTYFRKPVSEMKNDTEEIFCDDESRFQMIKRVFSCDR